MIKKEKWLNLKSELFNVCEFLKSKCNLLPITASRLMMQAQCEHHDSSKSKFNLFPTQTYINGKWVDSQSAKTFQVNDPATKKLLGSVPDCNINDLNVAVDAAAQAFQVWSGYTAEVKIVNYHWGLIKY